MLNPPTWPLGQRLAFGVDASVVAIVMTSLALGSVQLHFPAIAVMILGLALMLAGLPLVAQAIHTTSTRNVVVLGAGPDCQALAQEIERRPGYRVLGCVDDGEALRALTGDLLVLGARDDLPALTAALSVDTVVVTHPSSSPDALLGCLASGATVVTPTGFRERMTQQVDLESLDARWFLEGVPPARPSRYAALKRVIDIAGAALGLLVTLAVAPGIALANRLAGDRGPLLYFQTRVGLKGQLFRIVKFRTMRQDAESGGVRWASEQDPRVTRVGSFLRRSRLDELPQFWNVLRGDMSLVGPRPERPELIAMIEQTVPFYRWRHMVLPGITGWAQVKFPYGASVEDAAAKLRYDLYYLKCRSLAMDLAIMLRTVKVMALKIGAR